MRVLNITGHVIFKLRYSQIYQMKTTLNRFFLIGNFAWAFASTFANSGQKEIAKFLNFDHCTGLIYRNKLWANSGNQIDCPKWFLAKNNQLSLYEGLGSMTASIKESL